MSFTEHLLFARYCGVYFISSHLNLHNKLTSHELCEDPEVLNILFKDMWLINSEVMMKAALVSPFLLFWATMTANVFSFCKVFSRIHNDAESRDLGVLPILQMGSLWIRVTVICPNTAQVPEGLLGATQRVKQSQQENWVVWLQIWCRSQFCTEETK